MDTFSPVFRRIHQQKGVTLVETMVTLGILAAVTASVATVVSRYTEDTRLTLAAQHISSIGAAASNYINANRTAILDLLTDPSATYDLVLIDTATLSNTGYLPPAFSSGNGYHQNVCVIARSRSISVPSTPPAPPITRDVIEGLVVTEGGQIINDIDLALLAGTVGASAGAIYDDAPGEVEGVAGTWSLTGADYAAFHNLPNHLGVRCDGSPGAVQLEPGHAVRALWLDAEMDTTAFLYRDDVGRPELNRMNTDIDMNDNTLLNLPVFASGDACTNQGSIAQDSNGKMLSCQSGQWKPQGLVSVPLFADLPTCDDSARGEVVVVMNSADGVLAVDERPRLWVCPETGSVWKPVSANDDGDLMVYGALTVDGGLDGGMTLNSIEVQRNASTSGSPDIIEGVYATFEIGSGGYVEKPSCPATHTPEINYYTASALVGQSVSFTDLNGTAAAGDVIRFKTQVHSQTSTRWRLVTQVFLRGQGWVNLDAGNSTIMAMTRCKLL